MDTVVQLPSQETACPERAGWRQHTLKSAIGCVGVGVHTGRRVSVTLRPAEAGHGIVFHRTDLNRRIPARYDRVVDTRLSTVIGDKDWASARVGTIEHLMAAFAAAGIDNALVEVDGPELPILDGSAAPFLFLIDCAGIAEQAEARNVIEIRHAVRVSDGAAYAEFQPLPGLSQAAGPVLELDVSIDFTAGAIGRQSSSLRLGTDTFRRGIARARTFALAQEVEQLRAAGFAQGGSLDNAVVVDGDKVLNPGGLRMDNEFACHKLVDAVGDLALAGGALHGRFVAHRAGHALNNRLLRALLAEAADVAAPARRLEAVAA
ncbi:MAG: UDP-3-O-acyl-N-acetylglucosamine deacetylase [Acetobacteraceae bacterium]